MRIPHVRTAVVVIAVLLADCGSPTAPPRVLGHWSRDSVFAISGAHLDPGSLFLSEQNWTITGSGEAMGVDVPIPIAVTGTQTVGPADQPGLDLTLTYDLGGNITAHLTATLEANGTLRGRALYSPDFNGGGSDSLLFSLIPPMPR